jgi:phage gpG-like protein
MAVEILIDTSSDLRKIEKALEAMYNRGMRMQPTMQRLGAAMVGIVDRNFEAEGRPGKWKARSPITQGTLATSAQGRAKETKRYQKAKTGGKASIMRRAALTAMSNKILSRSGDLKKSITYMAANDKVLIGPGGAIPYARIHQLGGVIRPKTAKSLAVPCGSRVLRLKQVTIPARPYLIVPPMEIPLLAGIVINDFCEVAKKGHG